MQTIIDEYREYRDISAIFNENLPWTIYRTIYRLSYCFISRRDIVLLWEISFPASDISFPLCDISFQLCDISFPLRDISFLLCDISFLLKEISFCIVKYTYAYTSPKIIYDNDESSLLRSQLFEMASGKLNAFNVSWLSLLNQKHYWTYLPWFHEKNPLYNARDPITTIS